MDTAEISLEIEVWSTSFFVYPEMYPTSDTPTPTHYSIVSVQLTANAAV